MSSLNKAMLIGRLGKDPETKTMQSGAKVVNFSLATSEKYTDNDGNKQESTEWHNIVMWNKLADIAERYLRKGSQIYVEGKIKTRSWDDKDGNKKYMTEINVFSMTMLGGKSAQSEQFPAEPKTETTAPDSEQPENDLPF